MGKGKGRQSGAFVNKSQRAAYTQEIRQQVAKLNSSRSRQKQQPKASAERPRLRTGLAQLRGILRERQTHESFLLTERRRRAGYLPSRDNKGPSEIVEIVSHPPGWLLEYGRGGESDDSPRVAPLQEKCLAVLASCILEYLDAMGPEDLRSFLSLLPADTLADLSVSVSANTGVTNGLALALGKHGHVEALSFRAASQCEDSLTDDGILTLAPLWDPSPHVPESWEDAEEENTSNLMAFDILQVEGCNLRLKRLELIDCQSLSADALITFFERCSCITHLSLAGSLPSIQDGIKVFLSLPELLPALQVLDVTRCAWISTSALDHFMQSYYQDGKAPPKVHCEGCFRSTSQGSTLDW